MIRYLSLVVAVLSIGLTARPAVAGPIPTHLAIGDSSAFGETDRTRNPSDGDRGYVSRFADFLADRYGVRPNVVNLALDGETTASYSSGAVADRASPDGIFHNTNYAPFAPGYPSQRDLVMTRVAAEAAAGRAVRTVTVQLGANDLSKTAEAPGFLDLTPQEQQALVMQTLGAFQQNYTQLLGELRAVLPDAEVYVIGYHNPYGGSPDHPFYPLATPAVVGLNAIIEGVGTSPAFGARYVDFYGPVMGRERELTLVDTFPEDPVNYVHLNDRGYEVVSGALIRAASPTPTPSGLVLAAVGGLTLTGARTLRRRKARAAA